MIPFEQALISGLGVGAIYALIAVGISLVWSVTKTLNFAHGDILMVGVLSLLVAQAFGASGPVGMVAAIAVAAFLGMLLEKAVFRPLRDRPHSLAWLLGVVIFAAILRDIASLAFGARAYPLPFDLGGGTVIPLPGGAVLRSTYLWIFGAAILFGAAIDLLIHRTHYGRAVRAIAQSRDVAELVGIDTESVMSRTFVLAAVTGTVAGLLFAPLTFISVSLGWMFTLKGFTAAVLGGITKARGALVGGLLLGVVEMVAGLFVPGGYRDALVFLILIVVLAMRPQGLMGSHA